METRRSFLGLALTGVALGAVAAPALAADPAAGSLAGQLLVATEDMPDPRFARTVIYIVRHDDTGAQGFVVNRPLREVPLTVLLEKIGIEDKRATGSVRLHTGGPVDHVSLFVLHTADYANDTTLRVKGGLSLTWNADVLSSLGTERRPRRSLLALGYAGWGPGQLEKEMKAGGWVRAAPDEEIVFDADYQSKWSRAMARRKIDL